MSKRRGPTPRSARWAPWFEDPRSPLADGDLLFGNGYWTVTVELLDPERGMEGAIHLSIHDATRSVRHDWRDFQRIKNEIAGAEREAVELYPAESRLVDTSNEFHLWVRAVGERWPFGWEHRLTEVEVAALDPGTVADYAKQLGVDPRLAYRSKQRPRELPVPGARDAVSAALRAGERPEQAVPGGEGSVAGR